MIAASADTREEAQEMMRSEKIAFPIAFGLQASAFAVLTGAFFHAEKKYLHATGFLIDPSGLIVSAVYSTGAIGRLTASDALGTLVHLLKQPA